MSAPEVPMISEEEWRESVRRTDTWCGGLRHDWLDVPVPVREHPELDGLRAFMHRDGRRVVVTVGRHDGDPRWWLHVSVSRANRIPSYDDLADVKRVFVTDALQAVQVFPPRCRHVNIHPYVLHLWACMPPDVDGLPDFGRHGTI